MSTNTTDGSIGGGNSTTTSPPITATPTSTPLPFIPPPEALGIGNTIFLGIALMLCGFVVFIGMKQYISFKRTPVYAIFVSFLGWFICFSIAYLVPLDIIATDHAACEIIEGSLVDGDLSKCTIPVTYLPYDIMKTQWQVLYFGTLILCWLVFPLLQSFSTAGDFRFSERVKRAIKDNVVLYVFMGIGGLIGVIVILSVKEMDTGSFFDFVMMLANVYGVILIVITMGYGLIDVPRNLLRKGSHYGILRNYRVEAVVLKTEHEETRKQLIEHLKLIKGISDRAGEYDPFRIYLDVIISKCPQEYDQLIKEYNAPPLPVGSEDELLSYKKLVGIHSTLLDLVDRSHSAEILYERLLSKAFAIEDIIESRQRIKNAKVTGDINAETKSIQWTFKTSKNTRFEYLWHMYIFPYYFRIIGFLCSCLSGVILWSEIVLAVSTNPNYSPFFRVINLVEPGIGLQIFCFIPLIYMCVCSYSTLFKLRISNYYRLVPQQSNPFSIMFSANYLCRLAAPLAYNFIQICHINQDKNGLKSPFDYIMGNMNAFGDNGIGKKFTLFFPIFMIVVCVISFFNLHKRIAGSCCIQSLRVVTDTSEGAVDQGGKILKTEREERSLTGGVAPVKTRIGIVKDMFSNKHKHQGGFVDLNSADGAGSGLPNNNNNNNQKDPNRYKSSNSTKTSINIPQLSRTYTSTSGNIYSSNNENNSGGGGSGIKPINSMFASILGGGSDKNNNNNGSILPSTTTSGTSKGKDKQTLLSSYLDKMDFSFQDDDDDKMFDDIEMGAYGGNKNKNNKK